MCDIRVFIWFFCIKVDDILKMIGLVKVWGKGFMLEELIRLSEFGFRGIRRFEIGRGGVILNLYLYLFWDM